MKLTPSADDFTPAVEQALQDLGGKLVRFLASSKALQEMR